MIHTVLSTLLDTLFPPPSEVVAVRRVTTGQFLRYRDRHLYNEVIVLARYHEPLVRAAIHAHKFYANHHAKTLLTALLSTELSHLPSTTHLVPIPLSPGRKRTRGYNQVTTLLYAFKQTNTVLEDLLIRNRETAEQSHLPRAQRLINVRGAFTYNKKYPQEHFAHTNIVLVDDVVTTGTTLKEAAKTLRNTLPTSATVTCLAIAH